MKKMILVVLMLGCLPVFAEENRMKLAEELLIAMDMEKSIQASLEMAKGAQAAQLRQLGAMNASNSARAMEQQNAIMDIIAKEMSWTKIKGDMASIYAQTFTDEELKGLIEFYKGPVGRKFIEKQPELMQRQMQVTQKMMTELGPKIQQAIMGGLPMPATQR